MPLIINQDGKIEEVYYSAYDRLLLALKASKKRNDRIKELLDAERVAPRESK
jgi:hypothetical protein